MKKFLLSSAILFALVTPASANDGHCPNSGELTKILKTKETDLGTKGFTFDFESKNQAGTSTDKWEASNITLIGKGSLDEALSLPVNYNTKPNDSSWCLAQFTHDGANKLTIHLKKVNK